MTTSGDTQSAVKTKTEQKTITGGYASGEQEQRCAATLKVGSQGRGGTWISRPGDRCARKHKLVNGLCWIHRKFAGRRGV